MPAEGFIGFARAEILCVDIQRQRLAGFRAGDLQQAAANAAEAPVFVYEQMVDIGLGGLQREEADDPGTRLFCYPDLRAGQDRAI